MAKRLDSTLFSKYIHDWGCFFFTVRNAAQAHRLQIDGDRVPSFRRGMRADTIVPGERSLNEPDSVRRKLDRMAAVHKREGKEDAKAKVTVRSNFASG